MKTFFFWGDSLTLGVNDTGMLGWTGRFASTLGLPVPPTTFYNLGARKHSSKAILSRWKGEIARRVLPESSVRMMFCFGTVDMAAPQGKPVVSVEDSVENLRALLMDVTETYSKKAVRILSPFPVVQEEHCKRIEKLSAEYAAVCDELGVVYIDVFSYLKNNAAYMGDLNDGVHPGGSGCAMIADYLRDEKSIAEWIA